MTNITLSKLPCSRNRHVWNQIWMVMRLTTLLIIISTLTASAKSYSQKVSLSVENTSLENVFGAIRQQTGYSFLWNERQLQDMPPVSVSVRKASLEEAIRASLKGLPFTYEIRGKVVYIKQNPVPASPANPTTPPPLDPLNVVTGLVTDSTGAPLSGVSVYVKANQTIGSVTDQNGRYVLQVPDNNATLVFSMVGYDTQEIPVGGRTNINVKLVPASSSLEETVVTAFGNKQKRSDMVGSVTTITAEELQKTPSSNLTTAFAGRAAGLIAFQRSGEPGNDNADFFIRGVTTFGYKTDPLILIDGIELTATDLARVRPDDIASFSILKDATATAVYGARGANGVILVTTKEGNVGKARLAFRVENSISQPTSNVELADPVTYMNMQNEAIATRDPLGVLLYGRDKIANTQATLDNAPGSNPIVYPANDWRNTLLKNATTTTRANMSISGGGSVARYYVSGSYAKDDGLLQVDRRNNFNNNVRLNSYTLRTNVNVNITKTTELIARLSGSFDDYSGPIDGGAAMYDKIMHANPVLFPAYYPTDADHMYIKHIMFGNYTNNLAGGGQYLNPYADMVKGYKQNSRSLMMAQLELKQDFSFITQGLSFRTMMNTYRQSFFDVTRSYEPYWYQLTGYDKLSNTYRLTNLNPNTGTEYLGYSPGGNDISTSFYLESALSYQHTFKEKHGVSAMTVYQMRDNLTANAPDLQRSLPFRNLGMSGRVTYNYDKRYYVEFVYGYNGTERFAENHRFGFFPSYGVAWTVSNENFFKPLKHTISNLRLRATHGLIGNDAIGSPADRFYYLSNVDMNSGARRAVFGNSSGNDYGLNGVNITRYANTDITWEKATTTNIAIELGLFDRLNMNIEFYSQQRDHILMDRSQIPLSMGLTAPIKSNTGEASGRGTDISLDYKQFFAGGFWLKAMANFTYAASKFVVYDEPNYPESHRFRVGQPISQSYGLIAERLFVDDAEAAYSPMQSFGVYNGGDLKYLDVNRDGLITEADMVPIGNPTLPEIVYGFGFSAGYKGFDMSAFFQGLGNESFFIDPSAISPFVNNTQVLKLIADSYWSEETRDINAFWPRLSPSSVNNNNVQPSTWWMRDGSFLRLKNVEIGYMLPKKWRDKIHTSRFRIYANASNLMTFSKFKLWDIEMGGNGLGYPVQRVFNVGIDVNIH